ncbi:hypothetical protein BT69DRAFT_1354482 [Atractiella rhizophila]|nr:hypothetical protein BT69DRAFT_1354482 [Atractiella rhizophila]
MSSGSGTNQPLSQPQDYGAIKKASTSKAPTSTSKIEPKVFLASERTLFSWLRLSILMGSLSLALFNASGKDNMIGRYFGFSYSLISVGTLCYGWWVFEKRKRRIRAKAAEKDAFDELVGPVVICALLFFAVLANFILQFKHPTSAGTPPRAPWLFFLH